MWTTSKRLQRRRYKIRHFKWGEEHSTCSLHVLTQRETLTWNVKISLFPFSLQYVFPHHANIPCSRESSTRERSTRAQLQWEGVWISFVSFYNSPGKADNCLAVMSLLSILPMTIVGKPVLCARQEKQHFPHADLRFAFFVVRACVFFVLSVCGKSLWMYAIQCLEMSASVQKQGTSMTDCMYGSHLTNIIRVSIVQTNAARHTMWWVNT